MYNTNSDMLLGINQTLLDLFQQYRNNIDSLQEIHHDFYDILCQKGFLIDDNVDETESLIEKWNEEENNEKRLSLIINPTLDCNFRCWYCYEEHKNIMNMTPEVRKAISHFLQKQCAIPEREYIGLSFFGGEPLLMFDDVVMPLVHDLHSLRVRVTYVTTSADRNQHLCSTKIRKTAQLQRLKRQNHDRKCYVLLPMPGSSPWNGMHRERCMWKRQPYGNINGPVALRRTGCISSHRRPAQVGPQGKTGSEQLRGGCLVLNHYQR